MNEEDDLDAQRMRIAKAMGFVTTDTKAERENAQQQMQYIGFDNATLLKTKDHKGWSLYTNGIVRCNALVLSSPKGTYMAHIDVRILDALSDAELKKHTLRLIEAFESHIGEKPSIAHIVTNDGIHNAGILSAIDEAHIKGMFHNKDRIGINVGDEFCSEHINSSFNRANARGRSLLPKQMQWPALLAAREMRMAMERRSPVRLRDAVAPEAAPAVRSNTQSNHGL